ncbi:transmembrane protein 164 isoform X3 [Anopheles gambiae]|uniref:transmembrane protein 164 isoform X3 n=1 Tax=Anopheles gambiae TaxID=7165 RepID=UPI002AC9390C|nr:transmembrane protein 164 isoform X3 [Anopheles gambiae]XP_061514694.1 transmembrane protein 164 isoform X3 [Anopheles gambiae]XP_061514695.1 transmembrane protein 164 isoform X3 [Anopheles gambiae]XP_061514696.1 transmembrane protein 164 isoform X3 [Anopheles gambiae]
MLLSWAYDGVNGSVPRNTGPECADYLSPVRKLVETMVIIPLCLIAIKCAVSRLKPIAYQQMDRFSGSPFSGNRTLSTSNYNLNNLNYQRNMVEQEPRDLLMPHHRERSFSSASIASGIVEDIHCQRCLHPSATPVRGMAFPVDFSVPSWGKQFLLVTMTLTLGVELGFKFATRTVIYILNPCHITTIMQIYLLACNKSTKSSTVLFRLQMNYLNGPLLAFMFPETDSRQLPLESSIYWIQHALMCIIPIFLLKSGGVYNMEPLNDFTWNVIGYATLILYHFGILQVIASPAWQRVTHFDASRYPWP